MTDGGAPEADAESETGGDNGDGDGSDEGSHLDDIEDGAGCTEIWERLSERREE